MEASRNRAYYINDSHLPPSTQHQLQIDIETHPTWVFADIYNSNPLLYGEVRSSLYRSGENRFRYLKKLKETRPDRYWALYASANTHSVSDPEDESSEEEESDEEEYQELDDEEEDNEEEDDEEEDNEQEDNKQEEDEDEFEQPLTMASISTPSTRKKFKPGQAQRMIASLLQQSGGDMFDSIEEAKKFVYGKFAESKTCIYLSLLPSHSHIVVLCSILSDNDYILVDTSDPARYENYQFKSFTHVGKLDDGKRYNFKQLEATIGSVDARDFDEIHMQGWSRLICKGTALLLFLPKVSRELLVDRIKELKGKSSLTAFEAVATWVITNDLFRLKLVDFNGAKCNANLGSKDILTKDQRVKIFLQLVDSQVVTECGTKIVKKSVGYVRFNVVSEEPESLEVGKTEDHSREDALKGCDD